MNNPFSLRKRARSLLKEYVPKSQQELLGKDNGNIKPNLELNCETLNPDFQNAIDQMRERYFQMMLSNQELLILGDRRERIKIHNNKEQEQTKSVQEDLILRKRFVI